MRNLVSMKDLPDVIVAQAKLQEAHPEYGKTLIVLGPVGVGKSQIAIAVAKALGWYVEVVNLINFQPPEVAGWVTQVGDQMAQLKPAWLVRILTAAEAGKKTLLVFEEFPQCDKDVQTAATQILWDRRCAGHRLPDDCLIVANGNRKEDRANVRAMPEQVVSRFTIVEVEAELDATLTHFAKIGVHPVVSGYLAFSNDSLHRHVQDGTPFPSPRSWVAVSDILWGAFTDAVKSVLIAGHIGVEEAAKFCGFERLADSLTPPTKVFANPETAPIPSTKDGEPAIDGCFAMVSSLVAAVTPKTAQALGIYVKRLPVELHPVAEAAIKTRNEALKADGKPRITSVEITDVHLSTAQVLSEDG